MKQNRSFQAWDLFGSICTLFLVSLFLASSVSPLVTQKLISTPLIENPRYAITFPALDYIEDSQDEAVVAIGSSIIRSAVNGTCITEEIGRDGLGVYNLGISGANPYTEMAQIPALVQASPDLVMLDFGPNGLWNFYDSNELDEYIQFRFTINSVNMRTNHLGGWVDNLRDVDQQWVAKTDIERINLTKSYSQVAAEQYLKEYISRYFDLVEYEERAPLPGDPEWHRYLMEPYYRPPYFEEMSRNEIEAFMEERMPKKVNQSVYKPQAGGTLNHLAYDYIIHTLRENDIPVLLVATPHHPLIHEYLSANQLDGFNSSFMHYANLSGVYGINMFWETWHNSMFRDRNHIGVNGREYFCERISPVIQQLLESKQLDKDVLVNDNINLEHYLEERCNGSGRSYTINLNIEFIQAEMFSDCSRGEGIGSQDSWRFQSDDSHSGSGYLHALPEDHSFYKDSLNGSRLDYNLNIETEGEYFVWVKMRGEGYSNDSIELSWKNATSGYHVRSVYKSYGWSSNGQWEWEPEFNIEPISFNASVDDQITVSIWMQEDGVMIDEIMITTIQSLNPKKIDVYSIETRPVKCFGSGIQYQLRAGQQLIIEAEDFTSCIHGEAEAFNHRWESFNDPNSSGGTHLKSLPEEHVHMRDGPLGPRLTYDLNVETTGTFYLWLSMRGNSYNNDSIGIGWTDGAVADGMVYASFGWDSAGQWEWEPRVTREPFEFTIDTPGQSSIVITMREDGVEIDQFILTSDPEFDPIKELA